MKKLRQPLDIFSEVHHINSFVLNESQDVNQGDIVAINHWEHYAPEENDLALT